MYSVFKNDSKKDVLKKKNCCTIYYRSHGVKAYFVCNGLLVYFQDSCSVFRW